MDDAVDEPGDREFGRPNWARHLGRAVTPYALLLLMIGAAADAQAAIPLFAAAYAWGMAGNWAERLPSGLTSTMETAIAMGISLWAFGFARTLLALLLIIAADLWDDARDQPGHGAGERIVLAVALCLIVTAIAPVFGLTGIFAALIISGPLQGPSSDSIPTTEKDL